MRHLWLRGRDLFSFECLFLFFLLAGAYKSSSFLAFFNDRYDLTATTAIVSLLVGTGLVVVQGVSSRPHRIFLIIYLAYCGVAVASYVFWGIESSYANLKIQKLITFNTWAICAPLFVINRPERIERFIRLLFTATLLMGFDAAIRSNTTGLQRFVGSFGTESYQHLGVTTGIGIIIAAIGLLFARNKLARCLLVVIGAVFAMVLLLAGARQALAGLIVAAGFLFYSLCSPRMLSTFLFRFIPGLIVLFGVFYLVRSWVFPGVDISWGAERIFRFFSDDYGGSLDSSMRPQLWLAGIQVWFEHTWFGAGFGSFSEASRYPEYRQPHNIFIELLCELGVVGFLVGVTLWWNSLKPLIRREADPVKLTLGAIWLHLFTCAQFSGDITDNRQLFAFGALIISHTTNMAIHKNIASNRSVNCQISKRVRPIPRRRTAATQPF